MNIKRAAIVASTLFIMLCICFWPTSETKTNGHIQRTYYSKGFILDSQGETQGGVVAGYLLVSAAIGAVVGFAGKRKT